MSYQVLARKWRPSSFEQVVGQQHVLQALVNALDQQRLHHAYLFTGTRGVGKTSIARLLAKALNCEVSVSSKPCGVCQSCVEIDNGNFIDLIEVDAASKTKVEDTRDILDNVQYKPTRGRYKVYLIDEVHMLSRSSFNALLKTLEEPPEHVKFLFATTEANKLPITILSRCLQFNLKAITTTDIAAQLARVLDAEQLVYDQVSLNLIADAAAGSMRDALSLTDQAIAFGNGALAQHSVSQMLGTIDGEHTTELLSLAAKGEGEALLKASAALAEFAPDYDNLLKQMAKEVQLAAMTQLSSVAAQGGADPDAIKMLASQLDPEMLQLFYHLLLKGRQELNYAPDPRSGFEMILLRLLAFLPQQPREQAQPSHLSSLADQQQNILQQAQELTPSKVEKIATVSPSTAVVATEPTKSTEPTRPTEPKKIIATETKPTPKPITKAPSNVVEQPTKVVSEQFSEQDMMNMSCAMAADEGDSSNGDDYQQPSTPEQPSVENTDTSSQSTQGAGIDRFLSARKALRSKTGKAEEQKAKKPQAVKTSPAPSVELTRRAADSLPQQQSPVELPVVTTATEPAGDDTQGPVANDVVDPATLLVENTDDPWSVLINAMAIGGRLRLLAMQSSYSQEQDNISLLLRSEHRHLLAASAQEQLQQHLSRYLERDIMLTITIGDDDQLTPEQIAVNLHQQRLNLAKQCIETDEFVIQFEQLFGAQVDVNSINYRSLKRIS